MFTSMAMAMAIEKAMLELQNVNSPLAKTTIYRVVKEKFGLGIYPLFKLKCVRSDLLEF
jgi:hypothetical protein